FSQPKASRQGDFGDGFSIVFTFTTHLKRTWFNPDQVEFYYRKREISPRLWWFIFGVKARHHALDKDGILLPILLCPDALNYRVNGYCCCGNNHQADDDPSANGA